MINNQANIKILSDQQQVANQAALFWLEQAQQAVAEKGAFYVALSGGSTPRLLYEQLAQAGFARQVPWQNVHLYFGDERVVPPDHQNSNYRMVREALLDHVPLPDSQVHAMINEGNNDEASASRAASAYTQLLQQQLPASADGWPQFDLLMLGMGTDGHTASLFPDTAILREEQKPVASVYVEKLLAWRVSLTFPLLQRAKTILLLICGEDKAATLEKVFLAKTATDEMPVTRIINQPNVHCYLDEAAARLLER